MATHDVVPSPLTESIGTSMPYAMLSLHRRWARRWYYLPIHLLLRLQGVITHRKIFTKNRGNQVKSLLGSQRIAPHLPASTILLGEKLVPGS